MSAPDASPPAERPPRRARRNAGWTILAAGVVGALLLFYHLAERNATEGAGIPLYSSHRYDPFGTAALRIWLSEMGGDIDVLRRPSPLGLAGTLVRVEAFEPVFQSPSGDGPAQAIHMLSGFRARRLRARDTAEWIGDGGVLFILGAGSYDTAFLGQAIADASRPHSVPKDTPAPASAPVAPKAKAQKSPAKDAPPLDGDENKEEKKDPGIWVDGGQKWVPPPVSVRNWMPMAADADQLAQREKRRGRGEYDVPEQFSTHLFNDPLNGRSGELRLESTAYWPEANLKEWEASTGRPVRRLCVDRAERVYAAEFPFRAGRVVWIASPYPATNRGLRAADNARLLRALAGDGPVRFDEFARGMGRRATVADFLWRAGLVPFFVQLLGVLWVWRLATSAVPRPVTPTALPEEVSSPGGSGVVGAVRTLASLYGRTMTSGEIVKRSRGELMRRVGMERRPTEEMVERCREAGEMGEVESRGEAVGRGLRWLAGWRQGRD